MRLGLPRAGFFGKLGICKEGEERRNDPPLWRGPVRMGPRIPPGGSGVRP